jgi:phosphoserine phosphatase
MSHNPATLNQFRLLAMDMDSTLITIECIDEIADFVGKKADVAAITASAMRGEIDWPTSLRQRVALLAGLDASVLQTVFDERLRLSPGAETLVAAAKRAKLYTLLVSGGFTFFTDKLREQLGLDAAFSNTLEIIDNKLTGRVLGSLCDADAKARHVREAAERIGASTTQILVIGDGANDLKMMAVAGTSIAYHAKPVVQSQATLAINAGGLDQVLNYFPLQKP